MGWVGGCLGWEVGGWGVEWLGGWVGWVENLTSFCQPLQGGENISMPTLTDPSLF